MLWSALAALFFVVPAQAHHKSGEDQHREGCNAVIRWEQFRGYTVERYKQRDGPLTTSQRVYIRHMLRCLRTRELRVRGHEVKRRVRAAHRRRVAYYRLTPYGPCYGGRWAIPCYIVYCESKGQWGAYNASGAVGPYQLLGWGAIYPARTFAARLQNHRIARRLYLSQGSSPWVCA